MNIQINPPKGLHEIGGRTNNEDSIFPEKGKASANDRLFLVCDGVGGSNKGEVASSMVATGYARYIQQNPPSGQPDEAYLNAALKTIEQEMTDQITQNPGFQGMGTTLTLLYLGDKGATIAWIGDSRVYHFRGGKCLYRTEDHSLVNELVKNGHITDEQAKTHPQRNVILRAIKGSGDATHVDTYQTTDIQENDYFFLCSDGILEQVTDSTLSTLFASGKSLSQLNEEIRKLCEGKSKDNFSSYLIQTRKVGDTVSAFPTLNDTASAPKKPSNWRMYAIGIVVLLLMGVWFSMGGSSESEKELATWKEQQEQVIKEAKNKEAALKQLKQTDSQLAKSIPLFSEKKEFLASAIKTLESNIKKEKAKIRQSGMKQAGGLVSKGDIISLDKAIDIYKSLIEEVGDPDQEINAAITRVRDKRDGLTRGQIKETLKAEMESLLKKGDENACKSATSLFAKYESNFTEIDEGYEGKLQKACK